MTQQNKTRRYSFQALQLQLLLDRTLHEMLHVKWRRVIGNGLGGGSSEAMLAAVKMTHLTNLLPSDSEGQKLSSWIPADVGTSAELVQTST